MLNGASVNDPEAIKRPATGSYLGALGTETHSGWVGVLQRVRERQRCTVSPLPPSPQDYPRRDDDDEITSQSSLQGNRAPRSRTVRTSSQADYYMAALEVCILYTARCRCLVKKSPSD